MILLDTHALIWWLDKSPLLGDKPSKLLSHISIDQPAYISAITIWEIGMLVKKEKLILSLPVESWVNKVLGLEALEIINIDWRIATTANLIDYPYPDPADRFIIATAIEHKLQLATKDQRIRDYKKVLTVW